MWKKHRAEKEIAEKGFRGETPSDDFEKFDEGVLRAWAGASDLVKDAFYQEASALRITSPELSLVEQRYGRTQQGGDSKQLQLLMNNWTDGMADKTISYEVCNVLDSWRKLHHQHLP